MSDAPDRTTWRWLSGMAMRDARRAWKEEECWRRPSVAATGRRQVESESPARERGEPRWRESGVVRPRRTNPPVKSLVSLDRSVVAALLGTTPRLVPKSSANDLALEPCIGSSLVGRDGPQSRWPGGCPLLRRFAPREALSLPANRSCAYDIVTSLGGILT